MRQEAWDEVKIALKDYPRYDFYINQVRMGLLHPYSRTDDNIGGSKGTRNTEGLDYKVISITEDVMLRKLEFQKDTITHRLSLEPQWVRDMIQMMYFNSNHLPLYKVADFVGRDPKTCKKYHTAFMEGLARDLGVVMM